MGEVFFNLLGRYWTMSTSLFWLQNLYNYTVVKLFNIDKVISWLVTNGRFVHFSVIFIKKSVILSDIETFKTFAHLGAYIYYSVFWLEY